MAAIVHNTGTNFTLYYNVLNYIKDVCAQHPSVGAVGQGDVSDIDMEQFPAYPLVNINITNARLGVTTTAYEVQLIVADKQKNKNNESTTIYNRQSIPFFGIDDMVDIHANTLAIINDITSYIQRSVQAFDVDTEILNQSFSDRFNNGLAGWATTFVLTTHNDRNRCLYNLM